MATYSFILWTRCTATRHFLLNCLLSVFFDSEAYMKKLTSVVWTRLVTWQILSVDCWWTCTSTPWYDQGSVGSWKNSSIFVGWTHNIVLVMCSKPAKSPPREEIFCTGGFTSVSCFLVSKQSLHSSCGVPSFGCLTLRQYLLLDHLCHPHLRCPLEWGKSS